MVASLMTPNITIHRTSGKLRLPPSGDLQRWAAPSLQSAGRTRCRQSLLAGQVQSLRRRQSAAWPCQVQQRAAVPHRLLAQLLGSRSTGTARALLRFRTIRRIGCGTGIPSVPWSVLSGRQPPNISVNADLRGYAAPPVTASVRGLA